MPRSSAPGTPASEAMMSPGARGGMSSSELQRWSSCAGARPATSAWTRGARAWGAWAGSASFFVPVQWASETASSPSARGASAVARGVGRSADALAHAMVPRPSLPRPSSLPGLDDLACPCLTDVLCPGEPGGRSGSLPLNLTGLYLGASMSRPESRWSGGRANNCAKACMSLAASSTTFSVVTAS
eukprot:scaffold27136_cov118-Isochrysis_galbana.AAC.3